MAIATLNFFSRSLNRTVTVNAVIPSDKYIMGMKTKLQKGPFRTLYLLHGLLGNYTDWITSSQVQRVANKHNLAVVMPSGDNKFYCDSSVTGDMYGEFVSRELVEFSRNTFNLSRDYEDTYIGGLSMGGYGAIINGLRASDTFSRIAAFSSALIKDRILSSTDKHGLDFFTRTQYMAMFGLEKIEDFAGSDCDYDYLAEKVANESTRGGRRPKFYISCGTEDHLYDVNFKFKEKLISLGYDVTWVAEIGGHSWDFWNRHIELSMEWLK